jgi:DNA polymerase III delta subunit
MLILCCGPDTYRAVMRARDLEAAFRQKHDAGGSSVEHLSPGKGAADEIVERSLSVSLFTPMRFLRADELVGSCPKTKTKALVQALARDPERVIVVSVEPEKPDASQMKWLADVPKMIVNEYNILRGSEFRAWVNETAKSLGVEDHDAVDVLARSCDGDAWLASNELLKLAAGGISRVARSASSDGYGFADAFIRGDRDRHARLAGTEAAEGVSYPLLQQTMAAFRITQGDSGGIPPFVASRFKSVGAEKAANTFASALLIHQIQRSGLSTDQEALDLLP